MRDFEHLNECQQMLQCALALVHEEDLVAIFRAARHHEEASKPIELMNAELDKGHTLMEALAEPSPLYELFGNDWPEFRVFVREGNVVYLHYGIHGPPSDLHVWKITMASTGVVEELEHEYEYSPGPKPENSNPWIDAFGARSAGRHNWN